MSDARTVENWDARTPQGFVFALKILQVIRHDKVLVDCEAEIAEFLDSDGYPWSKAWPYHLPVPFFGRSVFSDRHGFTNRLIPFLKKLPANHKFGIEIRNRPRLHAEFANLLRDHPIALVLQDRSWMPNAQELDFNPITANWTYIRWLGDRKQIEAQTMTWDKAVVDRTAELRSWVEFCYRIMKGGMLIYAYLSYRPGSISRWKLDQRRSIEECQEFGSTHRSL
jgi:uncharacterized protein YecE (DUF72 family)